METNKTLTPLKQKIINHYIYNGTTTIPDLAKELDLSVPTVTKIIAEMCEDGYINTYGKLDTQGGRRPILYGLNPDSGYFLGVDIKSDTVNIALSNFNGEIIEQDFGIALSSAQTSPEALDELCIHVNTFIDNCGIARNKILYACVNISGRVNPSTGYSFSRYNFSESPLSEIFAEKIGCATCIENDTRAMTYGEFLQGSVNGEKNIIFVNLSWGVGIGIVIDGKIYEGKSGFAGEFGHINVFNNEILCHCGKKGCLETEVSGSALHREVLKNIANGKTSVLSPKVDSGEEITLGDIIDAINNEDILCIELIEELGQKLGRNIASLINIFNPEIVIIGGSLSAAKDYILQPIKLAVRKYSLNLVYNDTTIACSKLHDKAGVIGACLIARSRMFEQNR
jgi:predicted NBD/HSP70 family sugar kinase